MVSILKVLNVKTFFSIQAHKVYMSDTHMPNTLVSMFLNLIVWDFKVTLLVP